MQAKEKRRREKRVQGGELDGTVRGSEVSLLSAVEELD